MFTIEDMTFSILRQYLTLVGKSERGKAICMYAAATQGYNLNL